MSKHKFTVISPGLIGVHHADSKQHREVCYIVRTSTLIEGVPKPYMVITMSANEFSDIKPGSYEDVKKAVSEALDRLCV